MPLSDAEKAELRKKSKAGKEVPGPGAYDVSRFPGNAVTKTGIHNATVPRTPAAEMHKSPGPGQYPQKNEWVGAGQTPGLGASSRDNTMIAVSLRKSASCSPGLELLCFFFELQCKMFDFVG